MFWALTLGHLQVTKILLLPEDGPEQGPKHVVCL